MRIPSGCSCFSEVAGLGGVDAIPSLVPHTLHGLTIDRSTDIDSSAVYGRRLDRDRGHDRRTVSCTDDEGAKRVSGTTTGPSRRLGSAGSVVGLLSRSRSRGPYNDTRCAPPKRTATALVRTVEKLNNNTDRYTSLQKRCPPRWSVWSVLSIKFDDTGRGRTSKIVLILVSVVVVIVVVIVVVVVLMLLLLLLR